LIQIKAATGLFNLNALGNWARESGMGDFGRMLEQEIPRLRRYARALTRDPIQSDDLVQSTLVRALVKSHLWRPGTNLRHWLFRILHNQRVSEVRSLVREQQALADERVALLPPASADPDARITLLKLDRAIAALPESRRQVVLLIGLEEMSYDEAADILGIPLGTVRSRLARARATLREALGIEAEIARPAPAKGGARYARIAA
jgi:RNA polymerase sigma-70 factor (ECF subfamily)